MYSFFQEFYHDSILNFEVISALKTIYMIYLLNDMVSWTNTASLKLNQFGNNVWSSNVFLNWVWKYFVVKFYICVHQENLPGVSFLAPFFSVLPFFFPPFLPYFLSFLPFFLFLCYIFIRFGYHDNTNFVECIWWCSSLCILWKKYGCGLLLMGVLKFSIYPCFNFSRSYKFRTVIFCF